MWQIILTANLIALEDSQVIRPLCVSVLSEKIGSDGSDLIHGLIDFFFSF